MRSRGSLLGRQHDLFLLAAARTNHPSKSLECELEHGNDQDKQFVKMTDEEAQMLGVLP
jgi:hypothetical protein